MQPPRGKWTELARGCGALTFIAAALVDAPRGFFDLHYPTWLRWVVYTLWIMFLATLAAYVVIRAREIINYRRNQAGH
jgi:hypothetical protein